MRFEKTRDVLAHARDFHTKVSALYQRLAAATDNKRIQLVLNYMSQHEQSLEQGLAKYEAESPKSLLDTWFQFTHDETTLHALQEDLPQAEELTVDDVIDLAMKCDNCLIELYREMANSADSREINEMFVSLLELEKKEVLQLVRNITTAFDI